MAEVFGVTGWKNTGKTTLVAALVSEFTRRGLRVSTVKHAHKSFEIDHEGTDSHAHRLAGAGEVALVSSKRWALMHEVKSPGEEPSLETILAKLAPCDLIIVEGFKKSGIPKIECLLGSSDLEQAVYRQNDSVMAVASDDATLDVDRPVFDRNDVDNIADFITQLLRLSV